MNERELKEAVRQVAEFILESKRIVVFTGAGISTESGIPDFRSPGGFWERYTPIYYDEFLSSHEARKSYWQMHCETSKHWAQSQPNAGHLAIAELERLDKLDCVITQNVDGLHQGAGNTPEKVIELHGTNRFAECIRCRRRYPMESARARAEAGEEVPTCDACGGPLKGAAVFFGEPMPQRETSEAMRRSTVSDLFIVVGSSLVVYPAADMPMRAKQAGAKLALINLGDTTMDAMADVLLRAPAGRALSSILDIVRDRL
ncbi:MAG: NAD-dependent protein deacylase [Chloroflexota bacterium]|nr:MAG: NAD-dependent protein deacylase [Chloroflexota bacterium]